MTDRIRERLARLLAPSLAAVVDAAIAHRAGHTYWLGNAPVVTTETGERVTRLANPDGHSWRGCEVCAAVRDREDPRP